MSRPTRPRRPLPSLSSRTGPMPGGAARAWRSGRGLSARWTGWVWLLVALLLGNQGLASLHGLAHRGGGLPAPVATAAAQAGAAAGVAAGVAAAPGRDEGDAESGAGNFGHRAGSADCRLLDALLALDAPLAQAPRLAEAPAVAASAPAWRPLAVATATWPPFSARAPPADPVA